MLRNDDSAGKQERQPTHPQAWQCGMQAYDILREGWLSWSDGTLAGTMQVPSQLLGRMCHIWPYPCNNQCMSCQEISVGLCIYAQSEFSVSLRL